MFSRAMSRSVLGDVRLSVAFSPGVILFPIDTSVFRN